MKHIYTHKHRERATTEDDLYQTKEELKEAETRGEGKINWSLWEKLVQITKKELARIKINKCFTRHTKIRYLYKLNGRLIMQGYASEIAKRLGVSPEQVTYIANSVNLMKKRKLWLSNTPETKETIEIKLKNRMKK